MQLETHPQGAAAIQRTSLTLRQVRLLEFVVHQAGDASRGDVERYVQARFAARHAARVTHFLPYLISVGAGRSCCAAAGLAPAAGGRLFAETYLDSPAELAIAAVRRESVQRSEIIEIGNLVSTWKGGSLLLFVFLSELVARLGHRFVLFTATPEVERSLARLGYTATALGMADPRRLPDGGAQWGRYYERRPRVMFGEAPPAIAAARRDVLYRGVARVIEPQLERVAASMRGS